MPLTHAGVSGRLKLLSILAIVGGLLLASVSVALAQGGTTDPNSISADFDYSEGVTLDIPGAFFPGFDAAGSLTVPGRSLQLDGNEMPAGSITVSPLRLEESQTAPALVAPNTSKPSGSTAEFLGRAVAVSVTIDGQDVSNEARFNPPMLLTIDLTDSEWEEAADDPDVFVIRAWDPGRELWLTVDTATNPFDMVVTARVARAGPLALFMEQAPPPIQGGDVSLSSMTLLLLVMAGFTLLATGVMMTRGVIGARSK